MDKQAYIEMKNTQNTHWWFVGKRYIVTNIFKKYCMNVKKNRILDLGCGMGLMLEELSKFGDVYGMDFEKIAVEYCEKKFGDKVRQGSLPYDVPFNKNEFNTIVSLDVIEHIEEDTRSLETMYKLLEKGGKIIITVPALKCLWSHNDEINHHKRRYSKAELMKKVKEAGFEIEKCSYYNSLLFAIVFIIRMMKNVFHSKKTDIGENLKNDWKNKILTKIFCFESKILEYFNFQIGVSLILVAKK